MSINLNNYEIYFIDYFDGNLTAEEVGELMRFVENNPDLKQEFEDFENLSLDVEKIVFDEKVSLKKTEIIACGSINEENYEDSFIAYFEGDYNEDQKAEVKKFVALNASLRKELELFGKLSLHAEEVLYENKASLKKRIGITAWHYSAMAVAASITLLLSVFWFLNNENNVPQRSLQQISMLPVMDVRMPTSVDFSVDERPLVSLPKMTVTEIPSVPEKVDSSEFQLTAMNSQGNNVTVTGEIDCIKLLKYSSDTDLLLASASTKEKGLLAKIFNNNVNKLARTVVPEGPPKPFSNSSDPTFVKLLAGSVDVFNTITGSDVGQLKVYDKDGNLKNYKIETDLLTLNKTMN